MKRSLAIFVICFGVVFPAYGLVQKAWTLMQVTNQTATVTGSDVYLSGGSAGVAELNATNNSGTTPTLDVKVEHSPTCATGTWTTLAEFVQVTTGSKFERVHLTPFVTNIFPCIRAVATLGGTSPNYDVTVKFYEAE